MKQLATAMAAGAALTALAGPAIAQRGSDGHLGIFYWQAVSILNPYLSGGIKDVQGSSLVLEPLAKYDENGDMVPALVEEIPTVANGGVTPDLKSITWKIKDGLKWSDGTPVTADDVAFTWEYCVTPDSSCQQEAKFTNVTKVEAVDDLTVMISFDIPKPFPYAPFVGAESPVLQKAQFADCLGKESVTCTAQNFGPIGTGPFKVVEMRPNDVVTYEANPNYRDPDKPAFATVTLKGGGDAAAAARAVLQTGEFDYAWNLQLAPEVLSDLESAGKGVVMTAFGTAVERILVNLTNPDPALGEKRSTLKGGPHPILGDPAVRRALSMAIDRSVINDIGYGAAGKPTCNVLPAPAIYASTNVDWCLTPDVDDANKLLDDAGWVLGSDGVRVKDGKRLSLSFQTSTNAVRQDTQALIKDMWSKIGVDTVLRNIDASVFFGDPNNPDSALLFGADIQMYMNLFNGADPEAYMAKWLCNDIPSPDNGWAGDNVPRFCDPEYEKLVAEMAKTADLSERGEIAKKMNDMLVNYGALIPLIDRGYVSARARTLEGVKMNSWDSELWNAADWYRAK